jgi:GNAT superfamily N-acetyltransferase
MLIREANTDDIKQMQIVRNSVLENILSNPNQITDKDYLQFIKIRGKAWVCEVNNEIVGFSVVDLKDNNIWALFIKPEFEKKGIGKQLHTKMLDWYFTQTNKPAWLGTDPNTRAEIFYRKAGWQEVGTHSNGEIKFEMTYYNWISCRKIK